MSSYKELMQQRADLDAKIAAMQKQEIAGAVAKIHEIMYEYSLTSDDIFPQGKPNRAKNSGSGVKVQPKYRNPSTGETWTGRGKAPKWIADKKREDFLIQPTLA